MTTDDNVDDDDDNGEEEGDVSLPSSGPLHCHHHHQVHTYIERKTRLSVTPG